FRRVLFRSNPIKTPYAVTGDGLPDPPKDCEIPVTCGVILFIKSISAVVVPTSSAVIYLPDKESTYLANALINSGDLSVFESPIITAFPPPRSNPEIADL